MDDIIIIITIFIIIIIIIIRLLIMCYYYCHHHHVLLLLLLRNVAGHVLTFISRYLTFTIYKSHTSNSLGDVKLELLPSCRSACAQRERRTHHLEGCGPQLGRN